MDLELLHLLSSKRVLKRKKAIQKIKTINTHLARLALHYMSEHDPCYTVRNIAKQACPSGLNPNWDKTHAFSV